jgi:3-hydroxymyristoyl/3-hydroxydecanoyl-(acyl carrier protein) dehydratase
LLDEVLVVPGGGRYGQGYVSARSHVDPASWFFRAHFYQDPVMPGSLGLEAILQAMQAYAIQQDLGADFGERTLVNATSQMTRWKYRGQLVPGDTDLHLEVHLKRVQPTEGGLTVVGDASLWNGETRIYEVTDMAIEVRQDLDGRL